MPIVFIIFILIPIVEITLLIHVGQLIGTWYTIGLVLLSAFIGVNMLRYQGLSTLARAQQKMAHGEMPQQEMLEGLVLAVGGALLITPGFVTDIIGFCCLFPITRIGLISIAKQRFKHKMARGSFSQMHGSFQQDIDDNPFSAETPTTNTARKEHRGEVFEGEYTEQQNGSENILPADIEHKKNL
ncbi:MAG: hypothetical protein OFPII_41730 [Osedax symbiont Rs1]|nr:MAG: hypothetical protein OFPII_41730 [Osedax symbiont Rs1]